MNNNVFVIVTWTETYVMFRNVDDRLFKPAYLLNLHLNKCKHIVY